MLHQRSACGVAASAGAHPASVEKTSVAIGPATRRRTGRFVGLWRCFRFPPLLFLHLLSAAAMRRHDDDTVGSSGFQGSAAESRRVFFDRS
mmetsp:Transcript_32371/g.59530  ORF Transcript_32371/g.59530 Transcript_32371/m.59530 type:complete len:91 (-) Transcript_32371:342-614(-)